MALSSAWALVASHSLPYATLEVWAYCTQNTSTLTSTVYTELGVRCASYQYSADGVKAGITGASNISWGYTQFGSNAYHKLTGGSYTVSHNSTTGAASTTIYYWLEQTFGGDIGSPYSPASVRVDLPTMSVKPQAPTKGTVSVSNITYNGAKFTWSGFSFASGATWGKYQYSWNNSSWNNCGQNTSLTFTDRSPNTTYNFYVRLVDNHAQVSAVASTSFTTPKPSAPSKGTITVSNITESSAVFSWSGFGFGAGATWGHYRYSTNGSNWTSCGTDVMATLTGLSANTSYTFYVQLVDNYGQASASATVTFKTEAAKAWKYGKYGIVYIKVNDKWKYGKLYYKKDGAWVYTQGNYIKY